MPMLPTPMVVLASGAATVSAHGHDPTRHVQIGSLTKVVTGTALMRLAAAGILGLDDPVRRWLPRTSHSGMTLRHLAEHTSGLPRLPPGTGRGDPYRHFDRAALDTLLHDADRLVDSPPGAARAYSNLGYAVLGAALEAACAAPYEELIRDHVLEPLGVDGMSADPPPGARLLARGILGRPRRPWTMNGAILPAGGLWATCEAAARLLTKTVVEGALGELAPTWQRAGDVAWHNGHTRGACVFAAARPGGDWILVHRLGGTPRAAENIAAGHLAGGRP
ncbi:serine hydrolase domain-containing protein [Streptomyces sp. NPDC098789]|uniref:serine hydrolase domain-containing protein n=1 Tax=Streptomyces sp. NPDC098789 TaxID=3366098 RepID=UPI0037F2D35F